MKKSYVYKITCLVTGEFYFGSSFNANRDWYWGGGRKIKERIAQYGKENFIKEILGEFNDRTESHRVENEYIEKFRNDDKCLNKRLDNHFELYGEESRAKNSAANLGKHFSEEHKARISAAERGKIVSKETRDKISASKRGKHHTEETRSKMSASHRGEKNHNFGKHFSEEHRAKIGAANRGKPKQHKKHWRKNPITGKREWYD